MSAWLAIVGIGEDGWGGLGETARALVSGAELLVGGDRHHALVPDYDGQRLTWADGMAATIEAIAEHHGRPVCILASGDPMDYGAGSAIARRFDAAEMTVVPAPGAFMLACARMGWSRPDIETLTVHGRAIEKINLHWAPGARLLVLSRDGDTPAEIARLATNAGYGPSRITVLERLGGARENRAEGVAESWSHDRFADLNTVAVECLAGADAKPLSRVPGLPDEAFENDGQLTKREVRAATLAALAPKIGELLWDVGAGSGAIAIEWLRACPHMRAVAVERDAARVEAITRNAARLGVPELTLVHGEAPAALADLAGPPDAIFLGGAVAAPGMLDDCWRALLPGGRLAANAVTLEAEAALLDFHKTQGGTLTRIAVSRPQAVGPLTRWRPLAPVTQYLGVKQ